VFSAVTMRVHLRPESRMRRTPLTTVTTAFGLTVAAPALADDYSGAIHTTAGSMSVVVDHDRSPHPGPLEERAAVFATPEGDAVDGYAGSTHGDDPIPGDGYAGSTHGDDPIPLDGYAGSTHGDDPIPVDDFAARLPLASVVRVDATERRLRFRQWDGQASREVEVRVRLTVGGPVWSLDGGVHWHDEPEAVASALSLLRGLTPAHYEVMAAGLELVRDGGDTLDAAGWDAAARLMWAATAE